MVSRSHILPHLVIWLVTSVLLYFVWRRHRQQRSIVALLALAEIWMTAGLLMSPIRVARHFPSMLNLWVNAGFLVIACSVLFGAILDWLSSKVPAFTPGRRRVLSVAKAAAFAAPALALGA